ncbi:MAG TPA: methyltransferase domain-containing protein [Acidimicrobiales bacterium]|nr:methyltransferase domain-containing protein [Acidimicrobiales bacterium]
MDLRELEQGVDPSGHWYYQTKAQALALSLQRVGHTPGVVKDIGAGSGFFSSFLLERHHNAKALCIDPNYTDEQLGQSTGRLTFERQDTWGPADLYLFMDVIEHVPDDTRLLEHYVEDAPPGALFFISVPAFEFLWSGHDVYLQHYRRYTLPQLERVSVRSGLEVLYGRYLYGTTFPVVLALRTLRRRSHAVASDLRPAGPRLNGLLTNILSAENRLRGNRVAGSTAIVLARRR